MPKGEHREKGAPGPRGHVGPLVGGHPDEARPHPGRGAGQGGPVVGPGWKQVGRIPMRVKPRPRGGPQGPAEPPGPLPEEGEEGREAK